MKSTRIFLERINFGRFINMHMAVQNASFDWSVANPVTFTVRTDDDATLTPPMMQFTPQQAQLMMDELWAVGLRPTQGQQSEGQMGATTRHLEDMRALVFHQLRMEKP